MLMTGFVFPKVLHVKVTPAVDRAFVATAISAAGKIPFSPLTKSGKSVATGEVKVMVKVPMSAASSHVADAMFVSPVYETLLVPKVANLPFAENDVLDDASHTGAVPLLCSVCPFVPSPSATHADPLK